MNFYQVFRFARNVVLENEVTLESLA